MIAVIYVATYALVHLALAHSHRIGQTAVKVSSRLMGLILVAISVQFVLDGLRLAGIP